MTDRLFMVADTETSGMGEDAELLEIGVTPLRVSFPDDVEQRPGWRDSEILPGTAVFAKPQNPIPPEAMGVHHITDEMVAGAKTPDIAVPMAFEGAGDTAGPDVGVVAIVAHNADFDKRFIKPHYLQRVRWICTYKVAVSIWPDAPSFKNAALFYWLKLHHTPDRNWEMFFKRSQLHRALPDTVLTAMLFRKMLMALPVNEMVAISERPVLLPRVTFGEHHGKPWSEVPTGYLNWILDKDFDEDTKYTARYHKMERSKG